MLSKTVVLIFIYKVGNHLPSQWAGGFFLLIMLVEYTILWPSTNLHGERSKTDRAVIRIPLLKSQLRLYILYYTI